MMMSGSRAGQSSQSSDWPRPLSLENTGWSILTTYPQPNTLPLAKGGVLITAIVILRLGRRDDQHRVVREVQQTLRDTAKQQPCAARQRSPCEMPSARQAACGS
jgi:hypothetical protein